jgi:glucan 1,4-alpha-glucosidase
MKLLVIFLFVVNILAAQTISSPDKNLELTFMLDGGVPMYQLQYKGKVVIKKSSLGLVTKENSLTADFELGKVASSAIDETWQPVLGEYKNIKNNYNQLSVLLKQKKTEIELQLVFRLFNDGLGFRYAMAPQKNIGYFELTDEKTVFKLTGNHKTFWLQSDYDSQEYPYQETKFADIDVKKLNLNNGVGLQSLGGQYHVQSPLMMKSDDGLYINIFEAAVDNYPVMHLHANVNTYALTSALTPNAVGSKAFLRTPFKSPWRTIIVSDDARKIIAANTIILNLNEPSKIKEVSWIKPMKYVGIWWEMHVGKATWDYLGSQSALSTDQAKPTGKHGATTVNTKRYIDFAAKNGFDGVLVEGWNIGWEDWYGKWKEDVFDFVTPYPDFNIAELSTYAKSKGVKMIMHHETSGSAANYERWLDRAMAVMKKYNYPAVKSGYVGRIIPRGEFHDGQIMVNHYNHVAQRMAENKLMINSHESSRPTGMHRTYPNYIAAEAARGNEFNAWSDGNPPMHETILPFTRLMGGPMDYTPGIFEIKMDTYIKGSTNQVHTTLAKQLALYITMYSPLQMAADLPENYEKHKDAFQFIKDVAVDWDDTKILEAEPGDYLTIARKAKGKENWFMGAITDENARNTTLGLDFLTPGKTYTATIYEDAPTADWNTNPKAYNIRKMQVTNKSTISLNLAKGGGAAISFMLK